MMTGYYTYTNATSSTVYQPVYSWSDSSTCIYEGTGDWLSSASNARIKYYKASNYNYKIVGADWGQCTSGLTTGWTDGWSTTGEMLWEAPVRSPQERLRDMLRSRQAPRFVQSGRAPLLNEADIREMRARETLARFLGQSKYQDFLKSGFVSIRAKSGKVYQIFPGHKMTNVFQDGRLLESLCVVMTGDFPPTDSLIMRYLLILNDENHFRALANVFPKSGQRRIAQAVSQKQHEPLPVLFKRLKAA